MSSSPTARGTRAERGEAPVGPAARRAIPDASDTVPATGVSAGRQRTERDADQRDRSSLRAPERRLLTNLAMATGVILFITVVLPILMSLVRNF